MRAAICLTAPRNSLMSSGSSRSVMAVYPEMSEKITVTCRRSPEGAGAGADSGASGAPQEAAGAAANMTKTLLQYGKANLHAIGGKLGNLVGTKSWVHTEGGTCPLLLLWDAADGSLVAVIEAFALGNLRTGGISGVATDWMAAPEARSFAIIGTGKQSLSQVGAVLAVRPIEELRVFSPRPESRQ